MEPCLRSQVSCRRINDNHQAEKERYWKNRKNRKILSKERRIVYNSLWVSVCVCVCV